MLLTTTGGARGSKLVSKFGFCDGPGARASKLGSRIEFLGGAMVRGNEGKGACRTAMGCACGCSGKPARALASNPGPTSPSPCSSLPTRRLSSDGWPCTTIGITSSSPAVTSLIAILSIPNLSGTKARPSTASSPTPTRLIMRCRFTASRRALASKQRRTALRSAASCSCARLRAVVRRARRAVWCGWRLSGELGGPVV